MHSTTVSGVCFPKGFIHCSVSGHRVPVSGNPHFRLCCSVTEAIREALHVPTIGVCSQIWQHVPTRPSRSWLWTLRLYLCFWEMKTVGNTTQRYWEVESYCFKGWFLLLNLAQQHRLTGTLPSEAQHFLFVHSPSLCSYLPYMWSTSQPVLKAHYFHFTVSYWLQRAPRALEEQKHQTIAPLTASLFLATTPRAWCSTKITLNVRPSPGNLWASSFQHRNRRKGAARSVGCSTRLTHWN